MNRVIFILCVLGALFLTLLVSALLYLHHARTALLSERPEHGTSFLIEAQSAEAGGSTNNLENLKSALHERCSGLGFGMHWEPVSATRARLSIPKIGSEEAVSMGAALFRGGRLEFRLVHEQNEELLQKNVTPPGYEVLSYEQGLSTGAKTSVQVVVKKEAERGLSGALVKRAMPAKDNLGLSEIQFVLRPEAAAAFAKVTRDNVGRRLAILIDGQLFTAPVIQTPIESGYAQITAQFSPAEAAELSAALESPLPGKVAILQEESF